MSDGVQVSVSRLTLLSFMCRLEIIAKPKGVYNRATEEYLKDIIDEQCERAKDLAGDIGELIGVRV